MKEGQYLVLVGVLCGPIKCKLSLPRRRGRTVIHECSNACFVVYRLLGSFSNKNPINSFAVNYIKRLCSPHIPAYLLQTLQTSQESGKSLLIPARRSLLRYYYKMGVCHITLDGISMKCHEINAYIKYKMHPQDQTSTTLRYILLFVTSGAA